MKGTAHAGWSMTAGAVMHCLSHIPCRNAENQFPWGFSMTHRPEGQFALISRTKWEGQFSLVSSLLPARGRLVCCEYGPPNRRLQLRNKLFIRTSESPSMEAD